MHLLKAEEILRIHDAVLERFGGLKSQPMTPDAGLSKAQALVGHIRSAMTYNTAYDWNNVFLCQPFRPTASLVLTLLPTETNARRSTPQDSY